MAKRSAPAIKRCLAGRASYSIVEMSEATPAGFAK
jgi:hypothetical protein